MMSFIAKRRIIHMGSVNNIKYDMGCLNISRTFAIASSIREKDTTSSSDSRVSYLTNTCGLSPEVAVTVSQKLQKFKALGKPEKILGFFRDQGLDDAQISKMIATKPSFLLLANPDTVLLPKLKFLVSIGASIDDIAARPSVLFYSLEKKIIPCYNLFKSMLLSDEQIFYLLSRSSWDFFPLMQKNLAANVALLRKIGVPQHNITRLICKKSRVMKQDTDKFKNCVEQVLDLGFDPSSSNFYIAVWVIGGMKNSTWENKKKIYKSWGWSDDELLMAVKSNPLCMGLSKEKITMVMDFLVNKMGFPSAAIARTSYVLSFCLEKRILPRCKVTRVLQSKGLIKEDLSLYTIILPIEKKFLDRFVVRYQEQVPQLLAVYQGKVGLPDLRIGLGGMLSEGKP